MSDNVRKSGRLNKGQISIEFIAGFGLFIIVVSYIVYTALVMFPKYFENSYDNALRAESWTLSENLVYYLQNGSTFDEQSLDLFSQCKIFHYFDDTLTLADDYARDNYTYYKDLFHVDLDNDFYVTVRANPVVLTDAVFGADKLGYMEIAGEEYEFDVWNQFGSYYDTVNVRDSLSASLGNFEENDTFVIDDFNFRVDRIDNEGNYVILGTDLVECGKYYPQTARNSKVTRFLSFNGWITTIGIVYW